MKPSCSYAQNATHLLWIVGLTIAVSACATPSPHRFEFELLQDAQVSGLEGAPKGFKKGQKLKMGSQPYLVESPGYLSVLVLPGASELPNRMKLSLKKDERLDAVKCDLVQDQKVQDVLPEIERLQTMIGQDHAKDALARLDELQRKHPRVTFLNFLRASILVVLGDQAQALSILGVALRDFPQNEAGREMYRTISQGKEPPNQTPTGSQPPARGPAATKPIISGVKR